MNMNIDWTKVFRRFWKLGKALLICLVISTVVGFLIVGTIMGTAGHLIGHVWGRMLSDEQHAGSANIEQQARDGKDAWTIYERREAEARAAKERKQREERARWQWQQTHPTPAQIREQRQEERAQQRAAGEERREQRRLEKRLAELHAEGYGDEIRRHTWEMQHNASDDLINQVKAAEDEKEQHQIELRREAREAREAREREQITTPTQGAATVTEQAPETAPSIDQRIAEALHGKEDR